MQAVLRPEAELLIEICAFVCSDQTRRTTNPRTQKLLADQLDWAYVVRKSEVNGIIPIVSRWMSLTAPEQIPFAVKRKLALAAEANALRNEHLSAELLRILGAF